MRWPFFTPVARTWRSSSSFVARETMAEIWVAFFIRVYESLH